MNQIQSSLTLIADVCAELDRARKHFPPFNSAHEGYAVMLEEVDELKEHVWKKQGTRDVGRMRHEAIQVAAMALRFALEICTEEKGNV